MHLSPCKWRKARSASLRTMNATKAQFLSRERSSSVLGHITCSKTQCNQSKRPGQTPRTDDDHDILNYSTTPTRKSTLTLAKGPYFPNTSQSCCSSILGFTFPKNKFVVIGSPLSCELATRSSSTVSCKGK